MGAHPKKPASDWTFFGRIVITLIYVSRKKNSLWEFLRKNYGFFRALGKKILQTSSQNFPSRLSKLYYLCPEEYLGFIFQKKKHFNFNENWAKIFHTFGKSFSTRHSQNCILLVQENIWRKTYFEVYKFLTFLGFEQKICLIFIEYFFFKIIKNAFSLSRGTFCGIFSEILKKMFFVAFQLKFFGIWAECFQQACQNGHLHPFVRPEDPLGLLNSVNPFSLRFGKNRKKIKLLMNWFF